MSDWRPIEKLLTDFFRRRGNPLRDVCGKPFVAAEFHDEETGERVAVQYVVDLEELAREIGSEIRPGG